MLHILADDLFIETSNAPVTQYTEPLSLDGKSGVLIEAWLISAQGLSGGGVGVALEASNDLENWKAYYYPYQVSFSSIAPPWGSAPSGGISSVDPIPFEFVRLAITLNDYPATAVIRAGVRPRSYL